MSRARELREKRQHVWWLRVERGPYPLVNVKHYDGPCNRATSRAGRRNAARAMPQKVRGGRSLNLSNQY